MDCSHTGSIHQFGPKAANEALISGGVFIDATSELLDTDVVLKGVGGLTSEAVRSVAIEGTVRDYRGGDTGRLKG